MRIYKPAYSKPLPQGEKIKRDKDGQFVWLADRQGVKKKCRIKETAKGKRMVVESSFFTIVLRDHLGSERRLQADRDRASSEILGERVARIVYHRERGETLPMELQQWADYLPDATYQQLAGFGLVKARRQIVSQALEDMLVVFEQHLSLKRQRSPRYVSETLNKLRAIFSGCGFKTFVDIDDVVLDRYLLGLRQKKNLSTRTLNGYLAHMQQFCRFAIRVLKAAKASPLECMESFGSIAADRRRQRRALTAPEVDKLLSTTAASPDC